MDRRGAVRPQKRHAAVRGVELTGVTPPGAAYLESDYKAEAPPRPLGLDCFIVSGTTGLPEHLETHEGYATHRPEGNVSFEEAVDLMSRAIVYCRESGIRRLLIDTTRLTGFGRPSTVERFAMGERLARDAMAAVKLAVVARAKLIDPSQFGVTVARNRGLFTKAFVSEEEATEWLLSPNAE